MRWILSGVFLLGVLSLIHGPPPTVCRLGGPGRDAKTKSDLHDLRELVEAFVKQSQRLPHRIEELGFAVSNDPLGAIVPFIDPWGNGYCFERVGERDYRITCFGADGIPGGEGDDADISLDGSAR